MYRVIPDTKASQHKMIRVVDESEEDSRLEILLKEVDSQTELTLIHTNLSEHGEQYKKGWVNHYFKPMKEYFSQIKK